VIAQTPAAAPQAVPLTHDEIVAAMAKHPDVAQQAKMATNRGGDAPKPTGFNLGAMFNSWVHHGSTIAPSDAPMQVAAQQQVIHRS
jgi:hypothetical protein